jgi:hypothetical protein
VELELAFNSCKMKVEQFEREHNLPSIMGTDRQTCWARMIRQELLAEVFVQVLDATKHLKAEEASAVYGSLDKLKAENRSRPWIEKCQLHLGAALPFVLALPAAEALSESKKKEAAELREAMQKKSRDAISDIKQAGIFERDHGLPEILGRSVKQVNFGRRCRLWLVQGLTEPQLDGMRAFLDHQTQAGFWIGAFNGGGTIFELFEANVDRQNVF